MMIQFRAGCLAAHQGFSCCQLAELVKRQFEFVYTMISAQVCQGVKVMRLCESGLESEQTPMSLQMPVPRFTRFFILNFMSVTTCAVRQGLYFAIEGDFC